MSVSVPDSTPDLIDAIYYSTTDTGLASGRGIFDIWNVGQDRSVEGHELVGQFRHTRHGKHYQWHVDEDG